LVQIDPLFVSSSGSMGKIGEQRQPCSHCIKEAKAGIRRPLLPSQSFLAVEGSHPRCSDQHKVSTFSALNAMEYRYQIHIYFDGDAYIANVPELPHCKGRGKTHADALHSAHYAIRLCMEEFKLAGKVPPAPIAVSTELQNFCRIKRHAFESGGQHSVVKARLQRKFGILSNRELAARIGVIAADAPVMLSTALSGKGTRHVRCAIAIALGELPSRLWPSRPVGLMHGDDECFLQMVESTRHY
jgi:predicted RNase H-like HicB family nuclease